MAKETEAAAANFKFFQKASVTSTQDEVLEKILPQTDKDPWTLLLADQQSQGRGTRAREWTSSPDPTDQLLVSFGRKMATDFQRLPIHGLSLLVGESVWQSLQSSGLRQDRVFLKWPNDLMIASDGLTGSWRKWGGILCEFKKNCLVIGVGLNLKSKPVHIETAASLGDANPQADFSADFRKHFSFKMFSHFETAFQRWLKNPELFTEELSARLPLQLMKPIINSRVIVKKTGVECVVGGLSPEGFLLIYREGDPSPVTVKSSDEIRFFQFSPA